MTSKMYILLFFSLSLVQHTVTFPSGLQAKSRNNQNAVITDANAVLKYKNAKSICG